MFFKDQTRINGMLNVNGVLEFRTGMDASAAMAMAKRKGLGKAKHMHTQFLWVVARIQLSSLTIEEDKSSM